MSSSDPRPSIHPLAWYLIIGTGLSRAGLFITLPFLTIYISTHFGASAQLTGLIMGLGPLCGIVSAFLMGYVSDRFGRKTILQTSLFFWGAAFFGYIWANQIWMIAVLHMIYSACRSAFESVATALLTDVTDISLRKKVFHYRYYAINIGACIGPPIGSWLLLQHGSQGFWITSLVYFLSFLTFQYFTKRVDPQTFRSSTLVEKLRLPTVVRILVKDQALMLFIFANILMIMGFSVLETTLPQFLQSTYDRQGIKWFAMISFTNAITIVLFQFPLAKLVKNFSLSAQLQIGFVIFGMGTMSFGFFTHKPPWMIVSMVIFTFGEMLTFSNSYLWVDRISPSHMKGTYFGITQLNTLGFVVGPFLNGFLFENFGSATMFVVIGFLSIVGLFLFRRSAIKFSR